MSFSPIPDYKFRKLTDISVEFLNKRQIKLLMLDLDNTIGSYDEDFPQDDVIIWIDMIKSKGILPYIVSNSRRDNRVKTFADALEIPYINKARKPSGKALRLVMEELDIPPSRSALVGDQVYTDVMAANNANAASIVVKPMKFTNLFLAVRYFFELPFRALKTFEV